MSNVIAPNNVIAPIFYNFSGAIKFHFVYIILALIIQTYYWVCGYYLGIVVDNLLYYLKAKLTKYNYILHEFGKSKTLNDIFIYEFWILENNALIIRVSHSVHFWTNLKIIKSNMKVKIEWLKKYRKHPLTIYQLATPTVLTSGIKIQISKNSLNSMSSTPIYPVPNQMEWKFVVKIKKWI